VRSSSYHRSADGGKQTDTVSAGRENGKRKRKANRKKRKIRETEKVIE